MARRFVTSAPLRPASGSTSSCRHAFSTGILCQFSSLSARPGAAVVTADIAHHLSALERRPSCLRRSRAQGLPLPTVGQLLGKELQGRTGLGLLWSAQVDAMSSQICLALGGCVEGISRSALGGQLENPRSVRVEPELGYEPTLEVGGRELQLEDIDRAENGEIVQLDTAWRVGRE